MYCDILQFVETEGCEMYQNGKYVQMLPSTHTFIFLYHTNSKSENEVEQMMSVGGH